MVALAFIVSATITQRHKMSFLKLYRIAIIPTITPSSISTYFSAVVIDLIFMFAALIDNSNKAFETIKLSILYLIAFLALCTVVNVIVILI